MRFDILTLFPEMFESPFQKGVVGQAVQNSQIELRLTNPRAYTSDVHKTVDDRPFGGGDGMIMMAEPLTRALEDLKLKSKASSRRVIYLSPQGKLLTSQKAQELSRLEEVVLICGRYGGVDQRFLSHYVDEELSIGDYVLSGGELAAMVVMDAAARFLPGVLGNSQSAQEESFMNGLLESPQFTRPREFEGLSVPEALLSGNHERIRRWRYLVSILRTRQIRPELLASAQVSEKDLIEAQKLLSQMSDTELKALGLHRQDSHV